MTPRMSSGSSRAASAVEPTRSQNMTVSCGARQRRALQLRPQPPMGPDPAADLFRPGNRLEQALPVAE